LKTLKTSRDEKDESKRNATILEGSPFNYAVSCWIKHAMDVPSGINGTSLSKGLWELVRDFFWDNNGAAFVEWLRIFSSNREDWHNYVEHRPGLFPRCLSSEVHKSEVSSCLHVAASYGLSDILEWAHPEGLDLNIKARDGRTPLMYAAYVGEIDAVKAILSKGGVHVNLTLCGSSDCKAKHVFFVGTALENAIISRLPESITLLLKQPSIEVDQVFHGTTALGVAVNENYPEGINLLVGAGAKLALFQGETLLIPSSS
jgi:hypothetical protein